MECVVRSCVGLVERLIVVHRCRIMVVAGTEVRLVGDTVVRLGVGMEVDLQQAAMGLPLPPRLEVMAVDL